MIFADEHARKQLLEKGFVYTFRRYPHKEGKDWATDKRGGRKICDIYVELWGKIDRALDLLPYLEHSGFGSIVEWVKAIRRLYPKMKEVKGYIYRVEKL